MTARSLGVGGLCLQGHTKEVGSQGALVRPLAAAFSLWASGLRPPFWAVKDF